jgi:hypothetical protein
MRLILHILAAVLVCSAANAQSVVPDQGADVSVATPAYGRGEGPVIGVDAAHNNYHTADGRYGPFAEVLRNDGFRVAPVDTKLSLAALEPLRVLVIANALADVNRDGAWRLPTPSALAPEEITAVRAWVERGGSLLLVADHMPFAGAAQALARAFGFEFENGFATKIEDGPAEVFSRADGTLSDNAITRGRSSPVSEAQTFTGSSFRAPAAAIPILILGPDWLVLWPEEAWKFTAETPRRALTRDDLRLAGLNVGRGRVVVAAEAAMFTSQIVNGAATGFGAHDNKQLLLNVAEWLAAPPPVIGTAPVRPAP